MNRVVTALFLVLMLLAMGSCRHVANSEIVAKYRAAGGGEADGAVATTYDATGRSQKDRSIVVQSSSSGRLWTRTSRVASPAVMPSKRSRELIGPRSPRAPRRYPSW